MRATLDRPLYRRTVRGAIALAAIAAGACAPSEDSGTDSGLDTDRTDPVLEAIVVSPATAEIAVGATEQFTATGTFDDDSTLDLTDEVVWTAGVASDTGSATIASQDDASGLATAVSAGTVTITATDLALGFSASAVLTVTQPVQPRLLETITVSGSATVPVGTATTLTAAGTYTDGTAYTFTNLVWTSSDPLGFPVDAATGEVTVAADAVPDVDTATLTATETGVAGLGGSDISGTFVVHAAAPVVLGVTVGSEHSHVAPGGTLQLTATADLSSGAALDVTSEEGTAWASTNSDVTIDATGLATVAGTALVGNADITASYGGVESSAWTIDIDKVLTEVAVTQEEAWNGYHPGYVAGDYSAWATYNDGLGPVALAANWTCTGPTGSTMCTGTASGATSVTLTPEPVASMTVTATDPTTATSGSLTVTPYLLGVEVSLFTGTNYAGQLSVGEWVSLDALCDDVAGAGLQFEWTVDGDHVSDDQGTGYKPSSSGSYTAEVTVTDGYGATASDNARFYAYDRPIAVPGTYGPLDFGTTQVVALDGSASFDAVEVRLTYAWVVTSKPEGATATLSDAEVVDPTLTVDAAGTYTVALTVTDLMSTTDTASTDITFQ